MRKLFTLERFMGLVGLVALLLVGLLWSPTPAAGQEPEERPTIAPPTTTPLPGMGATGGLPASLSGTIINWGFRNEPDFPVQAGGTDWHLDTTSNAAGFYHFDGLSSNVVWLNVLPPEGSNAKALTADVVVRPVVGGETIVNLGIYEGDEPLPLPVGHTMTASAAQAQPGDRVTFTVWVKNNLDTPITHVQLTDYLPAGLGFVSAESNHGPADYADNLVTAQLGTLGSGDEAMVTVVTLVEPDGGESWELTNRSSLVYRESVATQASATVGVVGGPTGELPVTGAPMPLVAVGLGALVLIARRLRTHSG
jgi:uncharacterized repeat protein (TIGR01451 family)